MVMHNNSKIRIKIHPLYIFIYNFLAKIYM
nr:MAG TPA: hypothetical protein [Caudoviricetes sp.]